MVRNILDTAVPISPSRAGGFRRAHIPAVLLAAFLTQGCQDVRSPVDERSLDTDLHPVSAASFPGDVLPGTDPAEFAEALEAFDEAEAIEEGLGPIFNDLGCGTCHSIPAVGGSGDQIERRFGSIEGGIFYGYDDDHGGTLRQLMTVGTYTNPENGQVCEIPFEVEPDDANVNDVGRRTQPLFGLGLVDAMPDEIFDRLAAAQPPEIRGIANRVAIALPDPRDPRQSVGAMRVARFGWKANVPSLLQFSGDAYTNEMGITTQSCFEGQTIVDFAFENLPNNVAPPEGCNGGDLAPLQPAHADVPEFTDDAVGPCDGNLTEIQDDLILFAKFMESLAPPPQDLSDARVIQRGRPLFIKVGCAGCHVTKTFITPRHPFNGVPGHYPFQPFSDFLLHDMGSLGDRVGNTGDDEARTRLMRTQPLWGARFQTQFLHDGRAPDIQSAIEAHDGQGASARDGFLGLSPQAQEALILFVRTL